MGLSLGEGAATLLLARLFDALGIAVFFLTALIATRGALSGDGTGFLLSGGTLLGLTLLGVLFLVPAATAAHRVAESIASATGTAESRLARLALDKGRALVGHLHEIRARRTAPWVFCVTQAQWLCTFLTCWAIVRAIGIDFRSSPPSSERPGCRSR